jgi:hypothetical protein
MGKNATVNFLGHPFFNYQSVPFLYIFDCVVPVVFFGNQPLAAVKSMFDSLASALHIGYSVRQAFQMDAKNKKEKQNGNQD